MAADRQLADYIAQAYVYIADVASDPAFATPEHLEQALESYQHAVSLYTANDQPAHSTTQIDTAMLLVKMSRVQALLNTPRKVKSRSTRRLPY